MAKRRYPTGGRFLWIIAKVQAGLPLSIGERDLVSDTLRRQWFTAQEYNAYLRAVKLKHIEAGRLLAKHAVEHGRREEWVRKVHGFPTPEALKEFVKRERRRRR